MSSDVYIHISPGMRGGDPCIGGTRLPAEQFAEVWWKGTMTLEHMLHAWPSLTRAGLLCACWYCATYRPRVWGKRWGLWAKNWYPTMWEGDWKDVPMPSQEGKPC